MREGANTTYYVDGVAARTFTPINSTEELYLPSQGFFLCVSDLALALLV